MNNRASTTSNILKQNLNLNSVPNATANLSTLKSTTKYSNNQWNIRNSFVDTSILSDTITSSVVNKKPTTQVAAEATFYSGEINEQYLRNKNLNVENKNFLAETGTALTTAKTVDPRNYWKNSYDVLQHTTAAKAISTMKTAEAPFMLTSTAPKLASLLTSLPIIQRQKLDDSSATNYRNQQSLDRNLNLKKLKVTNSNAAAKKLHHHIVSAKQRQYSNQNDKLGTLSYDINTVSIHTTTLVPVSYFRQYHHRTDVFHTHSNDVYADEYEQQMNHIKQLELEHYHYDLSSVVVVTALFNIGRGDWYKYTRSYEQYLEYMNKLLKIKNRLVIFTDQEGANYVRTKRHQKNTEVRLFLLNLIKNYWNYDPAMKDHPESKSVDYDIVVNSKVYFVHNATQSSKFKHNAKYFAWIDAGYGHADQSVVPSNCHWKPPLPNGFVTVIKITPDYDKVERYSINDLYRVDWSVISGGFFGGDVASIDRFYRFYHKTFLDLLDERKVDDDQTVLTITMKNYPNLFYTLHSNGDWFALFKFFPC
uniref:Phospholipase D n=1 Tax=Syphacia muris TaxID=451379 RepID=A0A0N5AMF1_9BILA